MHCHVGNARRILYLPHWGIIKATDVDVSNNNGFKVGVGEAMRCITGIGVQSDKLVLTHAESFDCQVAKSKLTSSEDHSRVDKASSAHFSWDSDLRNKWELPGLHTCNRQATHSS